MTQSKRDLRRRMGRDSASLLAAADSPDAVRRAVQSVLHRQAHLLTAIHEVAIQQLLANGQVADAELLNDGLKPVIDILFCFDFGGINETVS